MELQKSLTYLNYPSSDSLSRVFHALLNQNFFFYWKLLHILQTETYIIWSKRIKGIYNRTKQETVPYWHIMKKVRWTW